MVIAVYEGCGMTEYGRSTWDGIDMSALPYRYAMPERTEEMEEGKVAEDPGVTECDVDAAWPANYIRAVVMAYHRYRYVTVPMIDTLLGELRELQIPYVLCYPARALSEERMEWLAEDDYGRHIVLEPGRGPADHREEIEKYAQKMEVTVRMEIARELIGDIQKGYEAGGLCIEEQIRQCLIHVAEHLEDLEGGDLR